MWCMDLETAAANFKRAIAHCDTLVSVYKRAGTGQLGRRVEEMAIGRAVIVIAVATWQAAMQDMVLACLEMSHPDPSSPLAKPFKVIAGRTRQEVGAFASPGPSNSRALLMGVGFDPRPFWSWKSKAGRGIVLTPGDIEDRLDGWLQLRHAIAHGHEMMPQVRVLQSVRDAKVVPDDPTIRLVDAVHCVAFVRHMANTTGAGLAAHLDVAHPAWI